MLVGRSLELARIDKLLDGARRGRSGALVLEGQPGIGKTVLLEAAAERASGMRALRTRGVESDAELPFAGLLDLLRPVAARTAELPDPQRKALEAAFALSPPAAEARFATYAGTLTLLAGVAEERPLLVLVDDAHWLDVASGEALAFAARRLHDEAVAFVWTVRSTEHLPFSLDGLERTELRGLASADAHELLPEVAPAVVDALVEATGGNPLALLELPASLTESERAGIEPLPQPLSFGAAVERVFGRRIERLPESARRALALAAAAEPGERDALERALRASGLALATLAPAEDAGLVTVDAGVEFRHPLVRAAAYSKATAAERRAAHAALARALAGDASADARAWHLARAALGADEEAAAALEAAALRARGRSWSAEARAWERSARLSADAEMRARRLLAGGEASAAAGRLDAAATLLADAQEATDDPLQRAQIGRALGSVELARGRYRVGAEMLESAAARLGAVDPEAAALALVDAARGWYSTGERQRSAAAEERAWVLEWPKGGVTEMTVTLSRADAAGSRGDLGTATKLWLRVAELARGDDPGALVMGGEALFSAGDDDRARAMLLEAIAAARSRHALAVLPIALHVLALAEARAGNLHAAEASASESLELKEALGQLAEQAEARALVAWIDAMLGREDVCREHVRKAHALLARLGVNGPYGESPLGLLALSVGDYAFAAEAFERTMAVRGWRPEAEVTAPRPVLPSLIEAYVRIGRTEDARSLLEPFERHARRSRRPPAIAAALRCRAAVDDHEEAFGAALAEHDRWTNAWERARTQLLYGEFLRREKRRAEARAQLEAAVLGFDQTGARLWADRARAELRATGAHARRRDPSTADELTPQERQVAALAAGGLMNKEIAARLFLSPKTIETHLVHVFRKLDVRSRTELSVKFKDFPDSIAAVRF